MEWNLQKENLKRTQMLMSSDPNLNSIRQAGTSICHFHCQFLHTFLSAILTCAFNFNFFIRLCQQLSNGSPLHQLINCSIFIFVAASMGCVNGKYGSCTGSGSPAESRRYDKVKGKGTVHEIRVPSYNYELKYSYLSRKGYYPEAPEKANQDSFCIQTCFKNNPNVHFFGVFDGHGQNGAQCSEFVKTRLCENLLKEPHLSTDAVQAYNSAFRATNEQLHRNDEIDDSMSGTTAITVLVRGKTVYVANVGDSRAVIARRKRGDNGAVAMDLSNDQTPFREDEYKRVKACGARVLSLEQLEGHKDPNVQSWGTEENDEGGDPPRLWLPNANSPGTAFTRSLGDLTAESVGVIADPEITELELTAEYPFFVIASDGVFEFLSSQAVIDMVAKFKDPHDACVAIVEESYQLWLQHETRTDDITIIVVQINGLHDDESLSV